MALAKKVLRDVPEFLSKRSKKQRSEIAVKDDRSVFFVPHLG